MPLMKKAQDFMRRYFEKQVGVASIASAYCALLVFDDAWVAYELGIMRNEDGEFIEVSDFQNLSQPGSNHVS